MKILPAPDATFPQSKFMYVRYGSQVDVYAIRTWQLVESFTGLSCGAAEGTPNSGIEIDPTNSWFITAGVNGSFVYDAEDGSEILDLGNVPD